MGIVENFKLRLKPLKLLGYQNEAIVTVSKKRRHYVAQVGFELVCAMWWVDENNIQVSIYATPNPLDVDADRDQKSHTNIESVTCGDLLQAVSVWFSLCKKYGAEYEPRPEAGSP